MAKRTVHQKDLSGTNLYKSKDGIIEPMPYFLYEVSIYKYWKNGSSILGTKFIKTKEPIHIKKNRLCKEYDGYSVEQMICMIGAPLRYIKDNKFPECKK